MQLSTVEKQFLARPTPISQVVEYNLYHRPLDTPRTSRMQWPMDLYLIVFSCILYFRHLDSSLLASLVHRLLFLPWSKPFVWEVYEQQTSSLYSDPHDPLWLNLLQMFADIIIDQLINHCQLVTRHCWQFNSTPITALCLFYYRAYLPMSTILNQIQPSSTRLIRNTAFSYP